MSISIKRSGARAALACAWAIACSAPSWAKQPGTQLQWLEQQLRQHPKMQAATAQLEAQRGFSQAAGQALYNPELSTAIEREGDAENFSLGLSQTLDWRDKRSNHSSRAGFALQAAQSQYQLSFEQHLATTLLAAIDWQAAYAQQQLARQQERQLHQLIDLVKRKQVAGDLGQIDVELSVLSLSSSLATTSTALTRFSQAQAGLQQLLPDWPVQPQALEALLQQVQARLGEQDLKRYLHLDMSQADLNALVARAPQVTLAKARWQQQQQSALLAAKSRLADPSVGINAGRNGDDEVIGLSLSLPLNLRNNYRALTRAQQRQSLALEAEYRALSRQQLFALRASREVLNALSEQYRRWQELMAERSDQSKKLLQQQWRSGDLSTHQYLLALAQRREGLAAGIRLQQALRRAQITWLLDSGLIEQLVKPFAQPK